MNMLLPLLAAAAFASPWFGAAPAFQSNHHALLTVVDNVKATKP
jgi:hypothetical protein